MMRNKSTFIKYRNPNRVWNRTIKGRFPIYRLHTNQIRNNSNRTWARGVKNFLRKATARHPLRLPYPMPGKYLAKWKRMGGQVYNIHNR